MEDVAWRTVRFLDSQMIHIISTLRTETVAVSNKRSVSAMGASSGMNLTRSEIDNHADTGVVGENCHVFHHFDRSVNISGFDSNLGVVKNKLVGIEQLEEETIKIKNTTYEEFENIWFDYFDLKTDYKMIKNKISEN